MEKGMAAVKDQGFSVWRAVEEYATEVYLTW